MELPHWLLQNDNARQAWMKIPSHNHSGIHLFIENGVQTGSFLSAILDNDLKMACARADLENQSAIFDIVYFLWNYAPFDCWGSEEKRLNWQQHRGLKGL